MFLSLVREASVNKNLGVTTASEALAIAPVWAPDHEANVCALCHLEFSMFNRRHHCRNCGLLCCGNCSSQCRLLNHIDAVKPVRVCDPCATLIKENK